MRWRSLRSRLAVAALTCLLSTGCVRAVTDGLAVGITEGVSDGIAELLSGLISSLGDAPEA